MKQHMSEEREGREREKREGGGGGGEREELQIVLFNFAPASDHLSRPAMIANHIDGMCVATEFWDEDAEVLSRLEVAQVSGTRVMFIQRGQLM